MHPKDRQLCKDHGSCDELSYERWMPEYGIDNFVKTEFTCGLCYYLAFALHQRTGWKIYVDSNHYYVINSNGVAVDIYGVRPTHTAPTRYSEHVEEGTVVNSSDYPEDQNALQWANQLIEWFPKFFGL